VNITAIFLIRTIFFIFLCIACIYFLIQTLLAKPNIKTGPGEKGVEIKVISTPHASMHELFGPNYTLSERLRFINGCELKSDLSYFGGWSGMTFIDSSLLLVSDLSAWLLLSDPINLCTKDRVNGAIGWLYNSEKSSLRSTGFGDIEAVSYDKGRDQLILSHESYSSGIFRGDLNKRSISEVPFRLLEHVPSTLHNLPKGRGVEAISWITDNNGDSQLLAIAERNPRKDTSSIPGWILTSDGVLLTELNVPVDTGFDISDLAYDDKCGLFILERKLSWSGKFSVNLKHVDIGKSLTQHIFKSELIFSADSTGSLIDNMEGISVSYNGQECKIIMISDSNFIKLQKTTFLVFSFLLN